MVGIDLVYIPRMKKILEAEYGEPFVDRVLTEEERSRVPAAGLPQRSVRISELFAMKEAIIKASARKLSINDLNLIRIEFADHGQVFAQVPGTEERFRVSASLMGDYILAVAVSVP